MRYKAFISYSHAADGKLAPAIQRALHRIAKPWYRLRTMRVFRDQTNLATSPGLWTSIESALKEAEFFVYLASPTAAQSPWVQKEVAGGLICGCLTARVLRCSTKNASHGTRATRAIPGCVANQS